VTTVATEFVWPTKEETLSTRESLFAWLEHNYPADESTLERAKRFVSEHHAPPMQGERQPEGA
jgi:hypothetical protein